MAGHSLGLRIQRLFQFLLECLEVTNFGEPQIPEILTSEVCQVFADNFIFCEGLGVCPEANIRQPLANVIHTPLLD